MRLDLVASWVLSIPSIAVAAHPRSLDAAAVQTPPQHQPDSWTTRPISHSLESAPEDVPEVKPELLIKSKRANFAVPVAGKEYLFSASVTAKHSPEQPCGNLDVLFSAYSGVVPWTGASGSIHLQVEESKDKTRHWLELALEPSCVDWPGTEESGYEAISAKVLSVDGTASEGSHFYIEWDRRDHYVSDVYGVDSSKKFDSQSTNSEIPRWHSLRSFSEYPYTYPDFRDEGTAPTPDHGEDDNSEFEQDLSQVDRIAQAIVSLESEEDRLKILQDKIDQQRQLVDHLTQGRYTVEKGSLKECSSLSCVIKKIVQKSKACIHGIYIRVVTFIKPEKGDECSDMARASAMKQINFMTKTPTGCSEKSRPSSAAYSILADSEDSKKGIAHSDSQGSIRLDIPPPDYEDSDSDVSDLPPPPYSTTTNTTRVASPPSLDNAPTHQSYLLTHKIHAALGVVFSALCLGCLTTLLHRRCCNPRAKADRAFRREQWRNQREYRRAARRQAWKDWWANNLGLGPCLCCGGRKDRRMADYKEKRSLILEQEERLEGHQQEEIRYLVGSQAEEGRAGTGQRVAMPRSSRRSGYEPPERRRERHATREVRANTGGSDTSEQLPRYHSRESSSSCGRPPSYRTRASSMQQLPASETSDVDLAARVANGFPQRPTEGHDWASGSDDETPDSSVVDVSPRLSSETIRTERSTI